MKLLNFRRGFAANSSSTHSLIFHRGAVEDCWAGGDTGKFGWQNFTAASTAEKTRYLRLTLLQNFRERGLPENYSELVLDRWLPGCPRSDDDYIDHQSLMALPSSFGTKLPDEQFFMHLKNYFLQEDLVILGGNDNDDEEHPLAQEREFRLPVVRDNPTSHFVCRFDGPGNYWAIFNQNDGTKVRFQFVRDPSEIGNTGKASAPELVDLKITDRCPFRCEYCYQGSTPGGKENNGSLFEIEEALQELQVFEVAIGGGEPTLVPDFEKILVNFRDRGIVPNFTTRNLAWLHDPQKRAEILDNCGMFAFSVDQLEAITSLAQILDCYGVVHQKASVQIVLGTVRNLSGFLERAAKHELQVTLLGYKTTGFGSNFRPFPYTDWLDIVLKARNEHYLELAIDTVLAAQSAPELIANGIDECLFTVQEGKFSCYIDAVENRIGPCSYAPEQMVDLPREGPLAAAIQSEFRRW